MSNTSNIQDLLWGTNYRSLQVPQYQRDYSWDEKQFNDLWKDIEDINCSGDSAENKHFIWLLVLIQDGQSKFDIVDWQQRLTTIFILLAALRDHFLQLSKRNPELGKKAWKKIDQINALIYQNPDADKKLKKLTPNSNDGDFYDGVIYDLDGEDISINDPRTIEYDRSFQSISPLEIKFNYLRQKHDWRTLKSKSAIKAYKNFYNAIDEQLEKLPDDDERIQFLFDLKTKIGNGLNLMVFASENESDAFNLFETLNDRWLWLASIDLIKNKILQRIEEKQRQAMSDRWDEIFGTKGILFNENSNLFLRYFYVSEQKYITKTELYKEWKEWIESKDSDELIAFIEKLYDAAQDFSNLKNPEQIDDAKLGEILLILRKTGSVQWFSIGFPLMKILKIYSYNTPEHKKALDVLWLVANVITRFVITEKRFNILEKKFPKIALSLSKKVDYDFSDKKNTKSFETHLEALLHVEKLLNEIVDEEVGDFSTAQIDEYLIQADITNNALATIILRLVYAKQMNHGVNLSKSLTLEHVFPIIHGPSWNDQSGIAEQIKYKLWNMLLVEWSFNSSLSNGCFADKKTEYIGKNVIDIQDRALSYNNATIEADWNENFVQARTQYLANNFAPLINSRVFPLI